MLQHYWKDTWSGMIFESRLFIIKYWLVTSEWLILKCVLLSSLWAAKRPAQESVCGGHSLWIMRKSRHRPAEGFLHHRPSKEFSWNFLRWNECSLTKPERGSGCWSALPAAVPPVRDVCSAQMYCACTARNFLCSCAWKRLNWVLLKQQIFFNPGADRQSWILVHNN